MVKIIFWMIYLFFWKFFETTSKIVRKLEGDSIFGVVVASLLGRLLLSSSNSTHFSLSFLFTFSLLLLLFLLLILCNFAVSFSLFWNLILNFLRKWQTECTHLPNPPPPVLHPVEPQRQPRPRRNPTSITPLARRTAHKHTAGVPAGRAGASAAAAFSGFFSCFSCWSSWPPPPARRFGCSTAPTARPSQSPPSRQLNSTSPLPPPTRPPPAISPPPSTSPSPPATPTRKSPFSTTPSLFPSHRTTSSSPTDPTQHSPAAPRTSQSWNPLSPATPATWTRIQWLPWDQIWRRKVGCLWNFKWTRRWRSKWEGLRAARWESEWPAMASKLQFQKVNLHQLLQLLTPSVRLISESRSGNGPSEHLMIKSNSFLQSPIISHSQSIVFFVFLFIHCFLFEELRLSIK